MPRRRNCEPPTARQVPSVAAAHSAAAHSAAAHSAATCLAEGFAWSLIMLATGSILAAGSILATGPILAAEPKSVKVGWGRPAYDHVPGPSLLLESGDQLFATGIYAHAPSTHSYDLGGTWKKLIGHCGLANGHPGSVIFAA